MGGGDHLRRASRVRTHKTGHRVAGAHAVPSLARLLENPSRGLRAATATTRCCGPRSWSSSGAFSSLRSWKRPTFGFLLPRMPTRFGRAAPLAHTVLFAFYHVWTLWLTPTRILAVLPLTHLCIVGPIVRGEPALSRQRS
jgi:hypothetical protein